MTSKPRPNAAENKQAQQDQLNAILEKAGFAYERDGDYFYSTHNCWQRACGYCRLYDEAAPAFNMILDAEPVEFAYGGKRWLIEFWKGQYGITTGGEIGLYYTDRPDVKSPRFAGTFYEAVPDGEMMQLSFALKKRGRVILRRRDRHFWLTGFLLGEFSEPSSLTMDAEIVFPDAGMAEAFAGALEKLGYTKREYAKKDAVVRLRFKRPHGKRNLLEKARDRAVQLVNYGNCRLYRALTAPYADTLDALEHLRSKAAHVFDFMLRALYAHAFFDAFRWLRELLEPPKPRAPVPGKLPPPAIPPEPPIAPERAPLILPVPVFSPRGAAQPRDPAPPPSEPKPSCLSELEQPKPAPRPNRPNRGRRRRP